MSGFVLNGERGASKRRCMGALDEMRGEAMRRADAQRTVSRVVLWVAVVVGLGLLASCFTELQDASCTSDAECFVGEVCVSESCQQGVSVTSTAGNAGTATVNSGTGNSSTSNSATNNGSTGGGDVLVSVRGRVTDVAGDPIARIRIETEPESEPALTDANGEYKLEITSAFGTVYTIRPSCTEAKLRCGDLVAQSITFQSRDIRDVDFIIPLECQDAELFCDDFDDDCNGQVDDGLENDCTGCGPLDYEPGTPCGVCLRGLWACASVDAVKCTTDGRSNGPLRGNEGDLCEGQGARFCEPGSCDADPDDPDTKRCVLPEGGCQ